MKTLLISHTDLDGVAPVILSKLILSELDYLLLDIPEVQDAIYQLKEKEIFNEYENIFITDLGLNEEICKMIETDSVLKNKIKVFDHHINFSHALNFDFITLIGTHQDGKAATATSIYYDYLLQMNKNNILTKVSVQTFVELVRQLDTWEWVTKYDNNLDAKRLADILTIFGKENFIDYYFNFFNNNDKFYLEDKLLYLLEVEQERINRTIEEKKEKMLIANLSNYKVGIIFSENYKSEIGSQIVREIPELDFVIIINMASGISYRGLKEINLGKVAAIYGGNGHKNAAGSPITNDLRIELIQKLFGQDTLITIPTKEFNVLDRIKRFGNR